MGLQDTVKELKEQVEAAASRVAEEEKTALAALDKVVEEVKEEPKTEEKKEEPKEEVKVEEKEEKPAEKKTDAEHAKERIAKKKDRLADDLAAARERIAALEARQQPVEVKRESIDQEPNKLENPVGWMDWKLREQQKQIENLSGWKAEQDTVKKRETIKDQAQREVASFEAQLLTIYPDYNDVKSYYANMLAASIKIVNPKITQSSLEEAVRNRLLTRAAEFQVEGYENPIEPMYLEAKALGYQPPKKENTKEEVKPDLDKVSGYRKRNAGMAGASGSGGEADVTAKVAATMTNAEFAKLKPDQKKRLFASLRA